MPQENVSMPSAFVGFPAGTILEQSAILEFLKSFAHREEGALLSGSRSRWGVSDLNVPILTNEFWTSRQRQASSYS
jgi:hypothetical protein